MFFGKDWGKFGGVTEGQVVPNAGAVGFPGGLSPTQFIVALNISLKRGDVQSSSGDPTICRSGGGSGVGSRDACNCKEKNDCMLFLDK